MKHVVAFRMIDVTSRGIFGLACGSAELRNGVIGWMVEVD